MFLVDKYFNDSNHYILHNSIIEKILDSFDTHNEIYSKIQDVVKKPINEFQKIINNLDSGIWRFANFQHLVVYGKPGSGKEFLVNKLLERIYNKENTKLNDIEYIINGYGNSKTKVMIKQSKFHIVIEPNSNGFDKYLIQEIIQNYAKTDILNIFKYKRLFKIVVINKIDNLSNTAQASLRRTMEKYADTCKFIFICDQLSKMIEPLRSRCIEVRVPLPSNSQILNTLLHIVHSENIELPSNSKISDLNAKDLFNILESSNKKIHNSIWLLELKKYHCNFDNSKNEIIEEIVEMIINPNNYNSKKALLLIKKCRELFYQLSITNIPTQEIISEIMVKLLKRFDEITIKSNIIEITSIFELRKSLGTRNIVCFEAYIIRLIYLFSNYFKGQNYQYNLDILEL
jgi:replication factor C subunit 3/5